MLVSQRVCLRLYLSARWVVELPAEGFPVCRGARSRQWRSPHLALTPRGNEAHGRLASSRTDLGSTGVSQHFASRWEEWVESPAVIRG